MGFFRSLREARRKAVLLQKQGDDIELTQTVSLHGRNVYINWTMIEDVALMLAVFSAAWSVIIFGSRLLHHGGVAGF